MSTEYRSNKLRLLKDKSWKTYGLSSLFSQYSPLETVGKLNLRVTQTGSSGASSEAEQSWHVLSLLGHTACRDLASKAPYRPLKLPPLVSMAIKICAASETVIPTSGLCFCGPQPLRDTGLPFHIEGPFVQDGVTRQVVFLNEERRKSISFSFIESSQVTPLSNRDSLAWNTALLSSGIEGLLAKALSLLASSAPASKDFYQSWPYSPRMPPDAREVYLNSTALPSIAASPLFFSQGRFGLLRDCYLSHQPTLLSQTRKYLKQTIALCELPRQGCSDLLSHQNFLGETRINELSANKLREVLR